MAETTTIDTDRQVGLAMLFGVIGLISALVMLVTGITNQQVLAGWGFAGSVLAGVVLVAIIHLYG